MAKKNRSNSKPSRPGNSQLSKPHPALKHLERLVSRWKLTGRSFDSKKDNTRGKVAIDWLPGGFFLQMKGMIRMEDFEVQSLEIVGYDAKAKNFSANVFSNMDGAPAKYYWQVKGDRVTHWTKGSKYTGTFSKEGQMLSGGWRPDKGKKDTAGSSYDAVMTRVNGK